MNLPIYCAVHKVRMLTDATCRGRKAELKALKKFGRAGWNAELKACEGCMEPVVPKKRRVRVSPPKGICDIEGCGKPVHCRGKCPEHYHKLWREGK